MAGALSHVLIFLSGGGVLVGRVYGRRPCFVSVRTIKGIIIIILCPRRHSTDLREKDGAARGGHGGGRQHDGHCESVHEHALAGALTLQAAVFTYAKKQRARRVPD
jgi:hypothetical protein